MREKPSVAQEKIITHLNTAFGLDVKTVTYLPIGADMNAWAFRIETDSLTYFLKLRRGQPSDGMLHAPYYLKEHGIREAVAPIPTRTGLLYVTMGDYVLILYPFLDGLSAFGLSLSTEQRRIWGQLMRRIHQLPLDDGIRQMIRNETYISSREQLFHQMRQVVNTGRYAGEFENAMIDAWQVHQAEIQLIYDRYRELGNRLTQANLPHVLCHADIHTANIILDKHGQIYIVDWDEVVIAPVERDLMFFLGHGKWDYQVDAFFEGYGEFDLSRDALAYYQHEWCVQEFAEWAAWILVEADRPLAEKQNALDEFNKLFAKENVVDIASQSYPSI